MWWNKPKPPQEQTIVQLRTDTYYIYPHKDVSDLQHVGYTAQGEPVFKWRVVSDADKKIILEREK